MNCIIFLTHNFNPEFLNTLKKINNDNEVTNYKVIVLFDNSKNYDNKIDSYFKNISIIKIDRIKLSYDHLGHTMYINYFRNNNNEIQKYDYFWIIENDVYYLKSFIKFIKIHNDYDHDLLVSEYGLRNSKWWCLPTLTGFEIKQNIGVLAVIMRLSKKLLLNMIDNLDINYFGYLEAILPHICIQYGFTIQQFLPETCGILTTNVNLPLLKIIAHNIKNNTGKYIENKIYHPIKL